MFEDFSSQEEQLNEQGESKFEPVAEDIIKEIGVPADLPPQGRAESISDAILELPPELQVPAIEMVVEDANDIKSDAGIAKILRNIIKTELGRGLEQELKDKIVDLAYEIDDVDLQKTYLVELEKAGILVRKYEAPMETKRVETTQKKSSSVEKVKEVKEKEVEVKEIEVKEVEVKEVEVKEFDFSGEVPPEEWELGGGAKVTGDGEIDEVGEGYLRLTENKGYDLGYALYEEELSTKKGLAFSFDYVTWGGNGADGITFFLVDGNTTTEEFSTGGVGGSLGYAPRYRSTEGMSNAYVGVGLDEFGNFSAPTEGRTGGPGRKSDTVSIRAGGDGFEGYEFVAGTDKLKEGIDKTGGKERPESEVRNVKISFNNTEKKTMSLTMDMEFGEEGQTERLFEDVEIPGEVPETVKFGFVATTGGAKNYHEVGDITAQEAPLEEHVPEVAEEAKVPAEKVEETSGEVEQSAEPNIERVSAVVEMPKENEQPAGGEIRKTSQSVEQPQETQAEKKSEGGIKKTSQSVEQPQKSQPAKKAESSNEQEEVKDD